MLGEPGSILPWCLEGVQPCQPAPRCWTWGPSAEREQMSFAIRPHLRHLSVAASQLPSTHLTAQWGPEEVGGQRWAWYSVMGPGSQHQPRKGWTQCLWKFPEAPPYTHPLPP